MSSVRNDRKLYVSNISRDARESDVGRLFEECGPIESLQHKGQFGFVEYDTADAAANAIRQFHDYDFMGKLLSVKHYKYRGGDFRFNPNADPEQQRPRFGGPKPIKYRLFLTGLADVTSWQDVKDFGRTGGDSVCYTDVFYRQGGKEGVIEYERRDDFENGLRVLDKARLNGRRVRVFDKLPQHGDDQGNGQGMDRSRSRSRDRTFRGRENGGGKYRGRDSERDGNNHGDRRDSHNNNMRRVSRSRSRSRPDQGRAMRSRSPPSKSEQQPPPRDRNYDAYASTYSNGRDRDNYPRRRRSATPPMRGHGNNAYHQPQNDQKNARRYSRSPPKNNYPPQNDGYGRRPRNASPPPNRRNASRSRSRGKR